VSGTSPARAVELAIRAAWTGARHLKDRRDILSAITAVLDDLMPNAGEEDPAGERAKLRTVILLIRHELDQHTVEGGAPFAVSGPSVEALGQVPRLSALATNADAILRRWRDRLILDRARQQGHIGPQEGLRGGTHAEMVAAHQREPT